MMRFLLCMMALSVAAAEPVWPGLAPGETSSATGDVQPFRKGEVPPVVRVTKIRKPTFTAHLAAKPNGAAVVILPGGGFGKVVTNKEGTEAAEWLNSLGVSAFVLSYRTTFSKSEPAWQRPLQDAQRLIALVRSRAAEYDISPDKIGMLAFSAGGQVGTRLLCDAGKLSYPPVDAIDKVSHRPDFALLVYPWNIYDGKREALVDGLVVPADCPPTFLVHTDDDRSSSLGAVAVYTALKKNGIPAALHVYGNGGHGYGLRPIKGSQISTWPQHAGPWLLRQTKSSD